MFREIKSFVLHNTFKAFISAEEAVRKMGGGKIVSNIFDVDPKYVGSSVRILKETDDATYIAKFDAKGRVAKDFKIMVTTKHLTIFKGCMSTFTPKNFAYISSKFYVKSLPSAMHIGQAPFYLSYTVFFHYR
jgi:hypothetical protein